MYNYNSDIIIFLTEYPDMSYTSQGKMTFLTRHVDKKEWMKPAEQLMEVPIHIGNVSFGMKQCNNNASLFISILNCSVLKNELMVYFQR